MAEVVKVNFESGGDANTGLGDIGGNDFWGAAKIVLPAATTCSAVSIYLETRTLTPDGDLTFRLETEVGGEPSGTLAHANATGVIAEVSITDNAWNKRTFSQFYLPAATYWLVMSIPAQDFGEHLEWTCDADGGVNTRCWSQDGGINWLGPDNYAPYFRLYGQAFEIDVHDCGETDDLVGG